MTVNYLGCCRRFPKNFANLSKMDMVIKDGNAKVTANMKLLYSVPFYLLVLLLQYLQNFATNNRIREILLH
jgi:hypothetical protein